MLGQFRTCGEFIVDEQTAIEIVASLGLKLHCEPLTEEDASCIFKMLPSSDQFLILYIADNYHIFFDLVKGFRETVVGKFLDIFVEWETSFDKRQCEIQIELDKVCTDIDNDDENGARDKIRELEKVFGFHDLSLVRLNTTLAFLNPPKEEVKKYPKINGHHFESYKLFEELKKLDGEQDNYFGWKSGGEGDNGEILMDQLDIIFTNRELS